MCLIAFAWQHHPRYPLVVAANRDETFARPTDAAAWWEGDELLAGRDLQGGGTWMGATRHGRFCALTNYRDPSFVRADAPSRGLLVNRMLVDERPPRSVMEQIVDEADAYQGFNLLAAQWHDDPRQASMWLLSHHRETLLMPVAPGIHALSNASLDTPWPKVRWAGDGLRAALAAYDDAPSLVESLLALLADRSLAVDADLPRTGVPRDVERALSASFIRMPGYGTRTSTVLLVDDAGDATFVERTWQPDLAHDTRSFAFRIATSAHAT